MPLIGEVVEREEGVFEWTVKDFLSLPDGVFDIYSSPDFFFGGAWWRLLMCPNGVKEHESEGYITAGLGKSFGHPVELNFSIGLKTTKNKIAGERHGTCNFDEKVHTVSWSRFLRRSKLVEEISELAPSGHLTFVCRMKCLPPSTDTASAISSAKCAHCKDATDAGSLPSHERKCLDRPIRCPECSDVVALRDWYAHECQPAKSKGEKSASAFVTKSTQNTGRLQTAPTKPGAQRRRVPS